MADNDDLLINIGAKTDTASFTQARDAVKGVGEAFEKTFDQVERSKSLDNTAKAFARLAVDEKDAANAAIQLVNELKEMGATEKEINKTVTAFEKQIEAIKKADEAAERKFANDAERYAKEEARINELREAEERRARSAEGLASRASEASGGLGDIGDNLSAISGVTGIGALGDIGGLFELTEAATRLKAGIQGLPETIQATAQSLGLIKTAQDAASAAAGAAAAAQTTQTTAAGALATASGGASTGIGAMVVALGPVALAAGAVALAVGGLIAIFSALQAQTAKNTEALRKEFAAQDEIDALVLSGATLTDAYNKQAELQDVIAKATQRRNEAEAAAAEDFKARSQGILGDLGARLGDALNLVSRDEAFNERVAETKKTAEEAEVKLKELNKQIEEGAFAADEAADTTAKASQKVVTETTKAAQSQVTQEAYAYQQQEQLLSQHLANETGLKGQAYNEQIKIGAQAVAAIQNGFKPLNMSGASNAFKPGSFGGLKPITNAPYTSRNSQGRPTIGTLSINTSANPQDVVKVLTDVGLV